METLQTMTFYYPTSPSKHCHSRDSRLLHSRNVLILVKELFKEYTHTIMTSNLMDKWAEISDCQLLSVPFSSNAAHLSQSLKSLICEDILVFDPINRFNKVGLMFLSGILREGNRT